MTEDEKPRGRPAAGARLSRLVALMMAAMVLLGVALFGLGLLRRSHADHSVPSNTDMSTPSVQSLLVKGDFKRQKLTDDQLDTLKGMYYAQDPADHGALKILFDKGEKARPPNLQCLIIAGCRSLPASSFLTRLASSLPGE